MLYYSDNPKVSDNALIWASDITYLQMLYMRDSKDTGRPERHDGFLPTAGKKSSPAACGPRSIAVQSDVIIQIRGYIILSVA